MSFEQDAVKKYEASQENRESKEGEINEELKRATAMEKVDILVKEVKGNKKQMQNILVHMQQVTSAIRQLRSQLQLAQTDDDATSVRQDKKRIDELKKKIKEHVEEVEKMRGDLVREQIEELKNGIGVGMSSSELQEKAEEIVDRLIKEIKE